MKNRILFILTFFYFTCLNAQVDRNLIRANKYFERAYYSEAIPFYKKSLDNGYSFEALKNIADSYFYIAKYSKASVYYKYLVKNYKRLINETTYFRYAETLKAKNDYNKANNVLRAYYKKHDSTKLITLEKSIKYLKNVKAIGDRFSIENLSINTDQSEFGAIQKGDTLIFAAPKKLEDGVHKKYGWTGNQYLDLYKASTGKLSDISSFSPEINTKVHESNIIFTRDGKTAYFTRNNFSNGKRKKDKNKITHVQLFKAEFVNGKWKNITPLSINNDNYSTEHPALSADEKTLYFASDMPKGFGSFDIYSVAILADGSLGLPENLGPKINTDKKEQFPFVDRNNNLYFSSNGHNGFGGLDVFSAKITEGSISEADNVGLPINSGYDDFSFNINSTTKEGYFSSNRLTGKGNDDIYKIVEQKPLVIENCAQFIAGTITDIDSQLTLENALVILKKEGAIIAKQTTNDDGYFKFDAACNSNYVISATKDGYSKEKVVLNLEEERKKVNDASLALKSLFKLEEERKKALALQQQKEHELRAKKAQQLELNRKKNIKKAIAQEKDIAKENGELVIRTEEINFDYKLWYLRRDAKKASKTVIDLMKKYPDMIVEIGTHSDMRGNNRYNKELSQKRANSVRYYLIDQGIEPDRIIAMGYGEDKPLIKCKTKNACSEEQHELNRRCEFVVKKIY
ncbi:WD40-like Beta Propeller Repeat [Tenacibaculum sp. MAR_2009_124]|uniref:OmpA family protein n=1 Tax=Tenacibaculum sp. MAR_2009_124 TaxID=1250059 RepID=UPI0008976E7D|nr:OmpA family protein [Tenacibaculum sp. MAR_2009_124]SEB76918.1 WD40-like Beta Propeller Repeat [Tenacibaculum sp. MAR_2009_124]